MEKWKHTFPAAPIHYLSEGNFLDIDASIIPASGAFAMKNEANLIKSYYPNDLSTAGVKVVGNDWSMTLGSASKTSSHIF